MTASVRSEYRVLLDAITPSARQGTDFHSWDRSRWERILGTAKWHRISPLLFCHLRSGAGAPDWVLDTLEQAYLANAARNLFARSALQRVLEALAGADVPAMLLKGAALVETAYPDPALREMLDLDILVPGSRMQVASGALAALGYAPLAPGEDAETNENGGARHHDAALVGADQVLAVELHRHIAIAGESSRFDIDHLWQRARRSTAPTQHLLPSPEDLLLHVCLHFTRNRLGGSHLRRNTGGALAQISDIARIIDAEEVDWSALAVSAHDYRMDASVFLALFAARELGVPVPTGPLAELRPANFDPALGRRLVALRVLASEQHLPVRSARWMLLPSREVLKRGWAADPGAPLSLARAYVRRARAHAPLARAALRQPWAIIQDHRLNDQIRALQEHA